jgi:hypothetical protein
MHGDAHATMSTCRKAPMVSKPSLTNRENRSENSNPTPGNAGAYRELRRRQ